MALTVHGTSIYTILQTAPYANLSMPSDRKAVYTIFNMFDITRHVIGTHKLPPTRQ